jgi:hypothetical protein
MLLYTTRKTTETASDFHKKKRKNTGSFTEKIRNEEEDNGEVQEESP